MLLTILAVIAIIAVIWLLTDLIFWSTGIVEAMAKFVVWAWLLCLVILVIGFDRLNSANLSGVVLIVTVPILVVRWLARKVGAWEARRVADEQGQYRRIVEKIRRERQ